MKATLNHTFLFGHKEFLPYSNGDKGGNIMHQIDSVYYFPNKENSRFRIAISISVNKNEININSLNSVHMTGTINGDQIIDYTYPIRDIAAKDDFGDIKIYKWTDYIEFSFIESGLAKFEFELKDDSNKTIKVEGCGATYFVNEHSPLPEQKKV